MNMTNQEVLEELLKQRDIFIKSGNFTKKNITNKDGDTIFFRTLEDIESLIELYRMKVAQENGTGGRIMRLKVYV